MAKKDTEKTRARWPQGVKVYSGNGYAPLNPSQKAEKYCQELHDKTKYTNSGEQKKDKSNKPVELSPTEAAYRMGYVASRQDNAMAYNSKNNKTAYEQAKQKRRDFWKNRRSGGCK